VPAIARAQNGLFGRPLSTVGAALFALRLAIRLPTVHTLQPRTAFLRLTMLTARFCSSSEDLAEGGAPSAVFVEPS